MKKYLKWIIPATILLLIVILMFFFSEDTTVLEEYVNYTPAEEISDEQMKRTSISLYFLNKENMKIVKDEKLVNAKNLIDNPVRFLLEELSKASNLGGNTCPLAEGTTINNVTVEKNIAILDLSQEFLNHNLETVEQEEKLILCIANTLCQLNEINGIKLLINGSPLEQSNLGLNLSQVFLPVSSF